VDSVGCALLHERAMHRRYSRRGETTYKDVHMVGILLMTLVANAVLVLGAHIWAVVQEQLSRGK